MKKGLYLRLALMNFRKNKASYLPFSLTVIGIVALFYMVFTMARSEVLKGLYGMTQVQTVLAMGWGIVGVFSVIFLYYTNNFLMKRRKKEFALYSVLGMEKKHLRRILGWEMILLGSTNIIAGLAVGVLFYKLAEGFFLRSVGIATETGFILSFEDLIATAVRYLAIFVLLYLDGVRQIQVSSPISLMQEAKAGDAVPKVNAFTALLGMGCLGIGYYMALTVGSPIEAMGKFFIAVILVMAGTYFSFMAVSILVLKWLQRNKAYYYRTKHFTAISGLVYRMKQNAMGLGTICILSTAVLILLSSVFALFLGMEDIEHSRFPSDVAIFSTVENEVQNAEIAERIDGIVANYPTSEVKKARVLQPIAYREEGKLVFGRAKPEVDYENIVVFYLYPQEDINPYLEEPLQLAEGQMAVFAADDKAIGKGLDIGSFHYEVVSSHQTFPLVKDYESVLSRPIYGVVPKAADLFTLGKALEASYRAGMPVRLREHFDFNGSAGDKSELSHRLNEELKELPGVATEFREIERQGMRQLYGGIFFTGLFLGLVFIIATALIIYYKQLTEGYEDQRNFGIMLKVGMTKSEVKQSIHAQIMTVFFLPLIMAGIHIAFAFPIVDKLLKLTYMTNSKLLLMGGGVVYIVFAVFYFLVYTWTSRTYYRLVTVKEHK